jgi:hypothetical protein
MFWLAAALILCVVVSPFNAWILLVEILRQPACSRVRRAHARTHKKTPASSIEHFVTWVEARPRTKRIHPSRSRDEFVSGPF